MRPPTTEYADAEYGPSNTDSSTTRTTSDGSGRGWRSLAVVRDARCRSSPLVDRGAHARSSARLVDEHAPLYPRRHRVRLNGHCASEPERHVPARTQPEDAEHTNHRFRQPEAPPGLDHRSSSFSGPHS